MPLVGNSLSELVVEEREDEVTISEDVDELSEAVVVSEVVIGDDVDLVAITECYKHF